MSLRSNVLDLRKRKREVQKGGGDKAIEKQAIKHNVLSTRARECEGCIINQILSVFIVFVKLNKNISTNNYTII